MRGLKKVFWGGRKRKVSAVVAAFLATAATAAAATFILYSGTSGGSQGTFATASTVGAITFTTANQPVLGPGDVSPVLQITAANNDPANPHGLSSLTETFTSVPSQCASFLTLQNKASIIQAVNDGAGAATVIPAGGSRQLWIDGVPPENATVTLGAAAPGSCANGTWSLSFAGVTT